MRHSRTRREIDRFLRDARVVDPHCHLEISRPHAANLAQLVLYHHVWIELVSAGMGQEQVSLSGLPQELEDPGIEPFERIRRALPYLPRIRNTTLGVFLRWVLRDLYGLDEELDAGNLEKAYRTVESAAAQPGWSDRVFDHYCGIEKAITVEGGAEPESPRMAKASEALRIVNLLDGKNPPTAILAAMDAAYGREVRTAADFRGHIVRTLNSLPVNDYRFLGAWVLPQITEQFADDRSITRILRSAREGRSLSEDELGSVTWYGLVAALEELRKTRMRLIQLIVGAEVLLPHRSIPHWSGRFTGAVGRLAGRFEDFHFSLGTASDLYTQDIAILAKHVPNVSVAGYWWHTMYPHFIRRSLEVRLDAVPASKIVGFFSDAYHCEWCYPKLKLVKSILGDILTERVKKGWYTLDAAQRLIHQLLYASPKRLYGL